MTTREFTIDELDHLAEHGQLTTVSPLAAFARRLLVERDALRATVDRLLPQPRPAPGRGSPDFPPHTTNEAGDCVSWCWGCTWRRARGLPMDATEVPDAPATRQTAAEFMAAHADDPGGLLAAGDAPAEVPDVG